MLHVCSCVSDVPKDIQDPLNCTLVEHEKLVPPSQCIEFHPQILHCNTFQRNHIWSHLNSPCYLCRTRTFPHMPGSCVKFAANNKCLNKHLCECVYRKLEENAGCFCCLSSNKLLSDVDHLHVPSWYDDGYQGIYLPKHGPICSKSMCAPLERLDFHGREVANWPSHDLTAHHVSKCNGRLGTRLEGNLKVVRREEPLRADTVVREDEVPAKKLKMAPASNEHEMERKGEKGGPLVQNETQFNLTAEQTDDTKADDKQIQTKIKQEIPEPQNIQAKSIELSYDELNTEEKDTSQQNSELSSDEDSNKTAMDVQMKGSNQGSRKSQQVKSKKGLKDNNTKPYNTRMVTSRPRTYSSDFVVPDEEDDWRKDKGFQMKGRQRTKLNRLLANEHERRRVAQLNSAYQDLRQLIPGYQCDTKLPKIKILKYAINYIAHLDDILGTNFYNAN